ncbi:molybdopterin biosynthesis protein [Haloferax mediterranei ATCC 33500]|nr:molybdopterin biosynthesis protein [Haloferax mediterranei]AFK20002.1 molybdenum cofactor biosynthesis protein MoeA [Haloferax mediterranei ATCC 33500]ELZ99549.1 molybdopterin biosynthesis protein MoeA/LysR substrate binding-domain-containing protein [Haloferax mediterranei ATCC 33500]QCQ73767.1 molybdopterin biosynthesis protein [Haloferax mediterranei ATCC 33500]
MRRQFRDLSTPAAARETIASLDLTPDSETVPLSDARGRVLAERIDAGMDVPGFDRASMDGYAVRARDTFGADEADPVTLELVGEVHAGAEPDVEVDPGTAVEISTGAVMPPGADAVVIVERTEERDDSLVVYKSVAPGDSVMPAGTDIAAGARALGPGTRLTPREIGLLSALGIDEVPVRGAPVVGIVSTGDELVRPGEELRPEAGQIYDVNTYTIAAGVEEAGGVPKLYPHAGDDYDEMERLLRQAADECDLVLSSGSTSASAVDVIYRVVEERGELLLHGVSVKPGKPMLVGTLGEGSAYIGLPGYPVSALTIFRTFAAPAIRSAAGLPEPQTATVEGSMAVRERYAEGRTRLMPVGLVIGGTPSPRQTQSDGAGEMLVYPVDKGSGATTSLVEADGVVEIPADVEYLAEGESVTVQLFSPDVRPPELLGVGEDDPALSRLLDRVPTPRYLAFGSREGIRRLRDGIPDVAVVAGETHGDVDVDAVELGSWTREWGLVVPAGNPDGVTGLEELVDEDLRFVNRDTNSGLRTELGDAIAALAEARGTTRHELVDEIEGFDHGAKAFESPARAVRSGRAAVGLGLRETADSLGLDFVSLGEQPVRVLANSARTEKPSVRSFGDVLAESDDIFDALTGFEKVRTRR